MKEVFDIFKKIGIRQIIRKLPINSNRKLELYNTTRHIFFRLKYTSEEYQKKLENDTFVPGNLNYSHEFWLKKYAGYHDYIYALIEHGVYFGENTNKIGGLEDWDMGSIITYGDSRINLLKKIYPDYHIVGVGPRIHYADVDLDYYEEIKSKIDTRGKTMVLYPHHSLYQKAAIYNVDSFIESASKIAKELNIKNVLVSLHPADISHGFNKIYDGRRFLTVTGGKQMNFLPRMKAILKVADITYSNTLGTHIGYSVYEGKPVVMDISSYQRNFGNDVYEKEQQTFAKLFNGINPYTITKEQWELCDYYFGFSHIKSPAELCDEFQKCKVEYEKRYKKYPRV